MVDKKKVYLAAGTIEQFEKVKAEYESDSICEDLEFIFLTSGDQITEFPAEIWKCSEMDRHLQNYNVQYFYM